jgi:uncharacterized protein (DUF885 family)
LLFSKGTTGFYFITPLTSLAEAAKNLDANQDFDRDRILSTAAHEAIPGHFVQLSIARRHPDFMRRIQFSDEFIEGWAFYGEELFAQLGLYGDDLDGRYFTAQWERVRGARAIVDPELASGAWSVDQAVEFFVQETGFSPKQSRAADCAWTRLCYFVYGWSCAARNSARGIQGKSGRGRIAARLP